METESKETRQTMNTNDNQKWAVYDTHQKRIVSRNLTKRGARNSADRRDLEYGGYRYQAMTMEDALHETGCRRASEEYDLDPAGSDF